MKLDAAQLAQFDRDGYLFFPSLFTPAETKVLLDEVPQPYAHVPLPWKDGTPEAALKPAFAA